MACTTATVVSRPSSRGRPAHLHAAIGARNADEYAKHGAFIRPAQKVVGAMPRSCGSGIAARDVQQVFAQQRATGQADASAMMVSSGNAIVRPMMREISTSKVSTPIACSASTSSFRCIEPISAAKALPERPAIDDGREQHPPVSRSTPM